MLTLIGAVLVAIGAVLLWYRGTYDVWPWSTYPGTLHVCGRYFQPQGSPETRAQIAKRGYHLIRHGDVPGWLNAAQVWTFDTVDGQQTQALPGGCHVGMWVRGGGDSFGPYALEGGP